MLQMRKVWIVAITLVLWSTAISSSSTPSGSSDEEEDSEEILTAHHQHQQHQHHSGNHHLPNGNRFDDNNGNSYNIGSEDDTRTNLAKSTAESVVLASTISATTTGSGNGNENVDDEGDETELVVDDTNNDQILPRVNGHGSASGDDNSQPTRNNDRDQGAARKQQPFSPPRTDSFWKRPRGGQSRHKNKGENHGTRENANPSTDENQRRNPAGDKLVRPNIILIITDDQDVELGSMEYMPETLKVFRDEGLEFRHGYCSTPMCCPSRSSLLTGLYVHNHQVYTNNDNCSSVLWREKYEKKTFASYLWSDGYYTSYIGKYLNKYDGSHIPYGWDEWNTLLMNSRFYNYTLNRNGRRIRYGNNYERDYYPDSIANDTLDFLSRMAGDDRNNNNKQPFLLVTSFPSPHGPEDSAPQYSQMFFNATPHHTPSYNHAPNADKQWILRVTNKMTPILKDFTNLLMTKRLQTLQSVDVAVKAIFDKLKETNLADNTYVFYTSDHGYHVGQFGLVKGKSMPFEHDIRVPYFLAAPKSVIRGGTTVLEPVLNIDLAPTFLELANITIPPHMDGRSLVPLIKKYSPDYQDNENFVWKDTFLIESSGRRETPVSALTTPANLMKSGNRKKHKDREDTKFSFVDNETVRINDLCSTLPHPCLPGQKKYCRKEKNRVRFRKCRQNIDFIGGFSMNENSNDPRYPFGENPPPTGVMIGNKCHCRFKRSTDELLEWHEERRKIDDEIEALKQKIERLRQRRREMRRKWIADTIDQKIPMLKPRKKGQNGNTSFAHNNRVTTTTSTTGRTVNAEDTFTGFEDSEDYDDDVGENNNKRGDKDDGGDDSDIDVPGFHHSDEIDEDDGDDQDMEDLDENPTAFYNSSTTLNSGGLSDNVKHTNNRKAYDSYNESFRQDWEEGLNLKFSDEDDEDTFPLGAAEDDDTGVYLNPTSTNNGRNGQRSRTRNKLNTNRDKNLPRLNPNNSNRDEYQKCDCYNDPRWVRQRERDERKRKKLMSKLRKKQRFLNRINDPVERHQAETCGTEERMNCFWHDNDHWRTAPKWTSGSFCFCMNSNNNTYSCLRSVNSTHNYLYCQFITGFKMYFDLRQDPYELENLIGSLPASQEDWMLAQLIRLKNCQGKDECWGDNSATEETVEPSIWEHIFGRSRRKKKRGGRRRTQ